MDDSTSSRTGGGLEDASSEQPLSQELRRNAEHKRNETMTNIAELYQQQDNSVVGVSTGTIAANDANPLGGDNNSDDSSSTPNNNNVDVTTNAVVAGAVANLCSATLGAGVLALPYALLQAGIIVGSLLLVTSATATAVSIRLLVRASDYYRLHSYETLAEQVISSRCRSAVEAAMLVFCGGCAVAYMIAVGDIVEQSGFMIENSRVYSMMAAWLLAMMPLSMLRRMQSLQFASAVGIAAIGTLVLASFVHWRTDVEAEQRPSINSTGVLWHDHSDPSRPPSVSLRDFLWPANGLVSVLTACPVVLFAFSCQTNVCQIYQELPTNSDNNDSVKPALMRRVTITAVCICAALYSSVSMISLADFGHAVMPNMLSQYHRHLDDNNNKSDSAGQIMQVATAAMAFAVVMAFPLNIFPARHTLIGLILQHGLYKPSSTSTTTRANVTVLHASPNETLTEALLEDAAEEDHEDEDGDPSNVELSSELRLSSSTELNGEAQIRSSAQPNNGDDNDEVSSCDTRLHVGTTLFLTGTVLALALVLPNISVVFGLLGGTASAMLGFCVPGLLGLQMEKDIRDETGERQIGTVVASWMLLGGGILVGFLTTFVTIFNTFRHSTSY